MEFNWNLFSTKVLIQYSRTKHLHNYSASSPLKLGEIYIQLNFYKILNPNHAEKWQNWVFAVISMNKHWNIISALASIKCAGISKGGKLLARWRDALFAVLWVIKYRLTCTTNYKSSSFPSFWHILLGFVSVTSFLTFCTMWFQWTNALTSKYFERNFLSLDTFSTCKMDFPVCIKEYCTLSTK